MINHSILVAHEPAFATAKVSEKLTEEGYEAYLKELPFKVGDVVTYNSGKVFNVTSLHVITKIATFKELQYEDYGNRRPMPVYVEQAPPNQWKRWSSICFLRLASEEEKKLIPTEVV